jgi:hypothetical protein
MRRILIGVVAMPVAVLLMLTAIAGRIEIRYLTEFRPPPPEGFCGSDDFCFGKESAAVAFPTDRVVGDIVLIGAKRLSSEENYTPLYLNLKGVVGKPCKTVTLWLHVDDKRGRSDGIILRDTCGK